MIERIRLGHPVSVQWEVLGQLGGVHGLEEDGPGGGAAGQIAWRREEEEPANKKKMKVGLVLVVTEKACRFK